VEAVWSHCVGYPGVRDSAAFIAYMKKCQIETTFYFADVNNHTVQSTLRALKVQASVADFIGRHQGKPAAELQAAFRAFYERVRNMAEEEPGRHDPPGAHQLVPLNRSMAAHHG
jgi:predicted adenine nucleotide alpha hydrolase (AANH) superfamily ATPase